MAQQIRQAMGESEQRERLRGREEEERGDTTAGEVGSQGVVV